MFVNNCIREQLEHFVFIAAVKDIKVNVIDNREYVVYEPYCSSVYLLAFSTVVLLTRTNNMWIIINGKNAVNHNMRFCVLLVYIFLKYRELVRLLLTVWLVFFLFKFPGMSIFVVSTNRLARIKNRS